MSVHELPPDTLLSKPIERVTLNTAGKGLRGDIQGGLAAALVAIPHALGNGALVFLPLGVGYIGLGVAMGLSAAIAGAMVSALLGKPSYQILSGSTTGAVILATLVATLAAKPVFTLGGSLLVMELSALVLVAVFLGGVIQLAFAWLRLGRALKFIPQAVLAGFMYGIALQLILRQVNPLLGINANIALIDLPANIEAVKAWSVAVGIVTFAVAIWMQRLSPKLPATMIALVAGIAAFALFRGTFAGAGEAPGVVSGDLLNNSPVHFLLRGHWGEIWRAAWIDVCATAVLLATVGSILTLLSAAVVDAATGSNQDGDRTLIVQGVGNLLSAGFGGMFIGGTNVMSLVNFQSGGRTAISALTSAFIVFGVLVGAGGALQYIPLAVIAGIMLAVAFNIVEDLRQDSALSGNTFSKANKANLVVIVLVGAATAFVNIIAAAVLGVIAASIILVARISATNIYRLSDGSGRSSIRARGTEQQRYLLAQGASIGIVELSGYVFFGTAMSMRAQIEEFAIGREVIILDFRRVYAIEASGARELRGLEKSLARSGVRLALSDVRERVSASLVLSGPKVDGTISRTYDELSTALEWAEETLLALAGKQIDSAVEIALGNIELFAALESGELARLAPFLSREVVEKGRVLFSEGDAGDRLFLITRGEVSINLAQSGSARATRLASFGPGMCFGEMALIEGKPRSAEARAVTDAVVYSLGAISFQRLKTDNAAIAFKLYTALARQVAARLRNTSEQLRRNN